MQTFKITGGIPLHGEITVDGNKNAVLPMIAAALLTNETITLTNVPEIKDVETMLQLAEAFGADIQRNIKQQTVAITATNLKTNQLQHNLCSKIRTSLLFTAPLLHRLRQITLPPPGGDIIGRRRVDVHFYGLKSLGANITIKQEFNFSAPQGLTGTDIFLSEASVTGTAQIIMAAVLAKGTTIIRNAAAEPHIQDLANMLNKMGAEISGINTNTLTIQGVKKLHGTTHPISSDFIEAASFLAIVAATKGELTIKGINPNDYRMIKRTFNRLGIQLEFGENTIHLPAKQTRILNKDQTGGIPVIDDGPWPHFPTDLMSVMIVLATQITGTVLFFEKMFESRMYFTDNLISMGANLVLCDPHRVVISGPAQLRATSMNSPDIRAGIALVGAALCAKGTSTIRNVQYIDRGYAQVEKKLRSLGAKITRIT